MARRHQFENTSWMFRIGPAAVSIRPDGAAEWVDSLCMGDRVGRGSHGVGNRGRNRWTVGSPRVVGCTPVMDKNGGIRAVCSLCSGRFIRAYRMARIARLRSITTRYLAGSAPRLDATDETGRTDGTVERLYADGRGVGTRMRSDLTTNRQTHDEPVQRGRPPRANESGQSDRAGGGHDAL